MFEELRAYQTNRLKIYVKRLRPVTNLVQKILADLNIGSEVRKKAYIKSNFLSLLS